MAWYQEAVFYHIYPLGFCGAPKDNDYSAMPVERLNKIFDWIGHVKYLGINAIYIGPVFESVSHGYDTTDYLRIDRRLGNNNTFKNLVETLHQNGIKVVVDTVFNHVGRDSFTNYIAYKGLYSSHNERDYNEIAHTLKQQFGRKSALYKDIYLYNFSYNIWKKRD